MCVYKCVCVVYVHLWSGLLTSTGWDVVKINCLWAADRLLGSAVGRERCHSWSIYPQNTCCIAHPRGNPQPTALQVSAEAGSEADFFARIRFWLWTALPACAELGFPILSCREGNERHGEFWGRVFKHCSLSPTLPTLSSLMHSKSIAFELLFLPPLCIFASCPFSSLCPPCLPPWHRLLSGIPLPCWSLVLITLMDFIVEEVLVGGRGIPQLPGWDFQRNEAFNSSCKL